jgi:uncharacterized protein
MSDDGGYFAPLEMSRSMLLTTFERDGTPVSACVREVAEGDRVYFRVRSQSGSGRRLRHTDAVQVTPCSLRGLFTYGSPLDATARPLAGEEARQAARKLARKRLIPLPHRTRRGPAGHYELLADDTAGDEGSGAPGQEGGQSGGGAERDIREVTRVECVQAHVADYGAAAIACAWSTPAPVALPLPLAAVITGATLITIFGSVELG